MLKEILWFLAGLFVAHWLIGLVLGFVLPLIGWSTNFWLESAILVVLVFVFYNRNRPLAYRIIANIVLKILVMVFALSIPFI